MNYRSENVAQLVYFLPDMKMTLFPSLVQHKPGLIVNTFNPSTWKVRKEYKKFKLILSYMVSMAKWPAQDT